MAVPSWIFLSLMKGGNQAFLPERIFCQFFSSSFFAFLFNRERSVDVPADAHKQCGERGDCQDRAAEACF